MLDRIVVDQAVLELRPDFAVLVITAEGLANGPSDAEAEAWLAEAKKTATNAGANGAADTAATAAGAGHVTGIAGAANAASVAAVSDAAGSVGAEDPHVVAWREAYRAFGAKPQRTRPSVDALLRRADALPAINKVVDAYNAISVQYRLPVGGEDLDAYQGPARLVRATGDEPFDVIAGGEPAVEHPAAGEVVWRDDAGVTCRRWNWRQCVRTRVTESTKNVLFLLERLEPYPLDRLQEAGDDLIARLRTISPDVRIQSRLIGGQDRPTDDQSRSTGGQDRPTAGQGRSTDDQDQSTAGQDQSTAGQGRSTGGQGRSTDDQDRSTGGQGRSIGGQGRSAGGQGRLTEGQDRLTGGQGRSTGGQGRSTGGQVRSTGGQVRSTGGQDRLTEGQGRLNGGV